MSSQSTLEESVWRARAEAHRARMAPWVDAHRKRRTRGEKHPVFDFLFTYYSFPPGRLLRWSPGAGSRLSGGAEAFGRIPKWEVDGDDAVLDPENLGERERKTAKWIGELCRAVANRPARFGCFGLHEWAMVYRLGPGEIRHESYPLRRSPAEIKSVVEAGPLCCTHHDAFRFFTPAAVPLNASQPPGEGRIEFEQAGCLHTNMDLYKWCYKLAPWVPSDLLGDAFELAAEIREMDMRASPYDLSALGFEPVEIETSVGRRVYEAAQRSFTERAQPLRERLLEVCRELTL